MEWIVLSLMAAFGVASADAFTKKWLGGLSSYEMGITRLVWTLPWLIVVLVRIPWPVLDQTFLFSVLAALPFEVAAFLCYMKAIRSSPLSLTLPFLAFTPAFIILTGRLILGESLTLPGMLGIFCIVAGAYTLNLSHARTGLLEPFRAIFREKGSLLMLVVSFIYSITSALGKLGVIHSSPAFFGVVYYMAFTLLMLLLSPVVKGARLGSIVSNPKAGFLIGLFTCLEVFAHMKAIALVQAAYMISFKRISLLFGVLYGAWLFHEDRIPERFTGAAVMVAGVFLIGWFG